MISKIEEETNCEHGLAEAEEAPAGFELQRLVERDAKKSKSSSSAAEEAKEAQKLVGKLVLLEAERDAFAKELEEARAEIARQAEESQAEASKRAKAEEDEKCKVCMDAKLDAVFVPCGHMFSCMDCARKLTARGCPVCRINVSVTVRVFK